MGFFNRKAKQLPATVIVDNTSNMTQILREVAQEIANAERNASELLSEEVLKSAFKTALYLAANSNKKDTYLVDAKSLNIDLKSWWAFKLIFIKACQECKIIATKTEDYINIDVASLLDVLQNLKEEDTINIDEKVRLMLHTGVYR